MSAAGIDHVPSVGPAILAFNHVSVLDGPCLDRDGWRRRRESRFLVADEAFAHALWGPILRHFDQIPIRREPERRARSTSAIATVRRGALAAIAPEGTVSPHPGELQRVRTDRADRAPDGGARDPGRDLGTAAMVQDRPSLGRAAPPAARVRYGDDRPDRRRRSKMTARRARDEGDVDHVTEARILAGDPS